MTRTGARAAALSDLLTAAGVAACQPPPRPGVNDLVGTAGARIGEVYRALGGNVDVLSQARPGAFDLCVSTDTGPLIIELDEEQHFNRYRVATLDFSWADELPWTGAYREYSRHHEADLAKKFISGGR